MIKTCALLFFFALVTISQANSVSRQPYARSNVEDDLILYQQQQQNAQSSHALGETASEPVVTQQRFGGFGAGGGAGVGAHAGGYIGGHLGGHLGGHVGGHLGAHVGGHVNAGAGAYGGAGAALGGYGRK